MKTCKHCSRQLDDNSVYCEYCGEPCPPEDAGKDESSTTSSEGATENAANKYYQVPWGAPHPGYLIVLLDQSDSMTDEFGAGTATAHQKKMDVVATALNRCINDIGDECVKGEEVRPRVAVSVLGYGGSRVGSAFSGELSGKRWVFIDELMINPLQVERKTKKQDDGAGGLVEVEIPFPIWVKARAEGATPMCAAFEEAKTLAQAWIEEVPPPPAYAHHECYPPLVLNITDGMSTDGDPLLPANELRQLSTDDGHLLLFNCHISDIQAPQLLYPSPRDNMPSDEFVQTLFQMSSELPQEMQSLVEEWLRIPRSPGRRGFVFNTDLVGLTELLRMVSQRREAPDPNR